MTTNKPDLKVTRIGLAPALPIVGAVLWPINTAADGTCLTIRARYDALGMADEVFDLKHFAKTAILIEYDK